MIYFTQMMKIIGKTLETKTYLVIVFYLLISSCKGKENTENDKKKYLIQQVIGKWGGLEEKTPVLNITLDSIFYFDRNKAYSYEINNGNIIINFPEHKGILRNVSIVNDTMIFFDDFPEPIKAIKIKD